MREAGVTLEQEKKREYAAGELFDQAYLDERREEIEAAVVH